VEGKIIEAVSYFNYLGNLVSNEKNDINIKLPRYNKINGIIKRYFGKHMTQIKHYDYIILCTTKASLFYYNETKIINKRDALKLEAAQMRFFRPLIGP
jgi:hypothetical protein